MPAATIQCRPQSPAVERNFVLALVLSFLVLAVWSLYTGGRRPPPQAPPAAEAPASEGAAPLADTLGESALGGEALATAPAVPVEPPDQEERAALRTDHVEAVFTSRGGALQRWVLLHFDDASRPGRPLVELTPVDGGGALATPLESLGLGDLSRAPYELSRPDERSVVFSREQGGIRVRKTYTLSPDEYLLRLRIEVNNESSHGVRTNFRTVWPAEKQDSQDFSEFQVATFVDGSLEQVPVGASGGFLFGGGSLDEPVEFPADVEWAGAHTRYFLAAIIPDVSREAAARFSPIGPRKAQTELAFRSVDLPPGQEAAREVRIFLGPKENERLEAIGSHLDEAILKGWFPALTDFFLWLLAASHRLIPNYGVAIILITVLVRALMAPIMAKQMRSMKRMSAMQPKIKEVQEKYADDKQRQSEEMMKLYRESGFNPLTGCLPMFLQLPVFIGLYYALQGSIQLRQAPFMAWIDDLSAPETLFMLPGLELPVRLLPLLMGASMVVQTRMTPTTMDPAQARMMNTVMPVMFTLLFYQFASGLVLYWFVSNVLGILQQIYTNRTSSPANA
jgi:YidC/Oxa1 family membrane protein insertase